jgi:hypothetical protein
MEETMFDHPNIFAAINIATKNILHRLTCVLMATLCCGLLATTSSRADSVPNNGGPIMQSAKVFLIFWQPSGSFSSQDSVYKATMQRLFQDLHETDYLSIATQYSSKCSGNPCAPQNTASGVNFGGQWTDTTAFPPGTLGDSDIQASVKRAIAANSGWSAGLSAQFVVFLPQGVQECQSAAQGGLCSGTDFCAYHDAFSLNGNEVVYLVSPQTFSMGSGCGFNSSTLTEGESSPVNYTPSHTPNQTEADWETVVLSHEFYESLTDPLVSTMPAYLDPVVGEIGDKCNRMVGGVIAADGGNVTLNGNSYLLEEIWSNGINGCSLGLMTTLTIVTGGDDLRGDSSATAALQVENGATFEQVTLKAQSDPSWDNNSTNQRSFRFDGNQIVIGSLVITLTSHNSFPETDDNWNINGIDLKVTDGVGTVLCEQGYSGNPVVRLTGSAGSAPFDMLNCRDIYQIHNDGSIWRSTGVVGGWIFLDGNASTTAIAAGDQLFQLHNDGSIWRATGEPGGWELLDGNPSTTAIAASSDQLFQLHNDGSIWRSTGAVGGWVMLDGNPATTAIAVGDQLYQLHNDGSIWRSTGAVGGWVMLDGNPATTAIAAAGNQLYQLHNDGSIWQSTGAVGGWVKLDGNSSTVAIAAGGNALYQLHNDGSIWHSTGGPGAWELLDGNSATVAIATAGYQLFQLHNDGSIWRSTGAVGGWLKLDGNSTSVSLAAPRDALFQLHNDGSIWRSTGAVGGWVFLDGNASTTAIAAGNQLFQLHNDGSIWRSTGVVGGWEKLDGNVTTTAIAAGNQLFQLHKDGSIWRSTGVVGGWEKLDGNAATTAIAVAGNQLFQLHNDGSIWRSTGVVGGWVMRDSNPATKAITAGDQLFQLHKDGSIWRSTGVVGGWEKLDGNAATTAIAVAGNQLFQLHNDGSIWRSTGVVGGWVMLDSNPATTAIVAGSQLFQLHKDGSIWRSTGVTGGWVMLDSNATTTAIVASHSD